MKKILLHPVVIFITLFLTSFSTNNQKPIQQTDCHNLSLLDEKYNGKDNGKSELLNYSVLMSYHYTNDRTYYCNGEPVTGKVFQKDDERKIFNTGFLQDGKFAGSWTYEQEHEQIGIFKCNVEYFNEDSVIAIRYAKLFQKDTLIFNRSYLGNKNYLDSSFIINPYRLHSVKWGQEPAGLNLNHVFKRKLYYDSGELKSFFLRDSLEINWLENEEEMSGASGSLKEGYYIDIINGKAERCYKKIPEHPYLIYVTKDYNGNYFNHGLFINFDSHGKPDSIFVNLDKKIYE